MIVLQLMLMLEVLYPVKTVRNCIKLIHWQIRGRLYKHFNPINWLDCHSSRDHIIL